MEKTMKTRSLRIIMVAALAIIMSFAFATSAFAAAPGDYTTVVYKTGTTDLSMANGAVTGADYDDDILTVYVQPVTIQMGPTSKTGYVIGFELDGVEGEAVYSGDDIIAFSFDLADLSGTTEFPAVFTIEIPTLSDPHPGGTPASADFVVYLP
jgi:hypothetical protein